MQDLQSSDLHQAQADFSHTNDKKIFKKHSESEHILTHTDCSENITPQ